MAEPFVQIQEDFLRFTSEIVWCTATTVDAAGRPRSRVLHPIFTVIDGRPVGWVLTGKTPVKTAHLASNPHVACAYWSPAQNLVYADCVATWVDDADEKRQVWDLFVTTPPPLGYDLSGYGPDEWRALLFTPLRLDPWRVLVKRFAGWEEDLTPRIWLADAA